MEKFEVNILGCGSALPTTRHFASSQVINIREKLYMIDCGEATQLQLRKSRLKFSRLNHIFISHLHGDHCFGLMGLISTFGMLGRTADLHIFAPKELEPLLQAQMDFFCGGMTYKVCFHAVDTTKRACIFEDRSMRVETIPLNHRVPCCGFLFSEKPTPNHLRRDMLNFYEVPLFEYHRIKNGADYVQPDGSVVPNSRLTTPSEEPRSYAYCSDTLYHPKVIDQIRGVTLLFHEATFAESELKRAKETFHTTASQAATIAKEAGVGQLIIGHFSARYDEEEPLLQEAQAIFPHTMLAKENLCIPVQRS